MREETYVFEGNPVFTGVQLVPLLVERKTPPPSIPANRLLPLTVRDRTYRFVNPVFTAVQLAPLLAERKIPLPSVPANRLLPLTVKDRTF
jgi:hypothetical protein